MISISNVKKRFGSVLALDGVSLQIRPGERVAFVGPNGSGKTTLLRALLGLVRIEGSVSINGIDVSRAPAQALLGVAYIPQIAPPIEASVEELVNAHSALRGLPEDGTYERARRLGLDARAVSHARFRDLSGGMKQKLLAAMALASESHILVCDEPTANLDANARAGLFEQVAERAETDIVVLCSHRVDEVQKLVGRVVELGDGKVVRDAPLGEALSGIRAFRVDVELRPGAAATVAALHALGFHGTHERWLGADMHHAEKIEFVTQVLPEHHESIVDMSIVPTEQLAHLVARGPRAISGDSAE